MKSYFIPVTTTVSRAGEEKVKKVRKINIASIHQYYKNEKGFTNIHMESVSDWMVVHETPEQIDELIYGSQSMK